MKNKEGKYVMIDFGGIAYSRLSYGWKRSIWSPFWCSQPIRGKNQVTTAKNDFLELGYTMKTLENNRNGVYKRVRYGERKLDPIRTGFSGKLKRYMDRVELIDERNIREQDYKDIQEILHS
jgi:hypothetical protein